MLSQELPRRRVILTWSSKGSSVSLTDKLVARVLPTLSAPTIEPTAVRIVERTLRHLDSNLLSYLGTTIVGLVF